MILREINQAAELIGQDYWIFTAGMKGMLMEYAAAAARSPIHRARVMLGINQLADRTRQRLQVALDQYDVRLFNLAIDATATPAHAAGDVQILVTSLAEEQKALVETQITRDLRAATTYVIRESLASHVADLRAAKFQAIDRAGRRWDSHYMLKSSSRHHFVLTYNDVVATLRARAGATHLKLTDGTTNHEFPIEEYADVRAASLHPNTNHWIV